MNLPAMFTALRNPRFPRLYTVQTISQIGDALTWVGLALLAAQLGGPQHAPAILATALTIRVTAFVLLSPLVGRQSLNSGRFDESQQENSRLIRG